MKKSFITQLLEHTYINAFCMALMGGIVFSPLSSKITIGYLGLPISLPEVLLVPFVVLFKDKFKGLHVRPMEFLKIILLLTILVCLGTTIGGFSLFSVLSTSRAWLYLLITYYAFKKDNDFTANDFMWLAFGSLVGWLLTSLMNMKAMVTEGEFDVTYGLTLSIPIFLSIAYLKNKRFLLILGIAVILAILTFAGIRKLLLVFLFALFLILIQSSSKSKGKFSIIAGLSLVLYLCLPLIEELVKMVSPMLYFRIFTRTEELLSGGFEASQDTERLDIILDFFNNFYLYIFPRGMVSLQTAADEGTGVFNDFPLLMFSHIFGLLGVFYILITQYKIYKKNLQLFKENRSEETFMVVISMFIMLLLLLLEGFFVVFPFAAPITGLILGKAYNNICTIDNYSSTNEIKGI